jgi:hypothetical protein
MDGHLLAGYHNDSRGPKTHHAVVGSFFCSSAAMNPALAIIANALRVGEHLAQRLK